MVGILVTVEISYDYGKKVCDFYSHTGENTLSHICMTKGQCNPNGV